MIDQVVRIFRVRELRKRILFTAAMLAILQIGAFISVPGVDPQAIKSVSAPGGMFSLIDLFSGGAFRRVSIFALGIMPYISASIILQLLTVVWPYLEEISKSGEEGRKKINQWTRYGTVLITAFQALMFSVAVGTWTGAGGAPIVPNNGIGFRIMCMFAMTTGTVLIMWMGEQITERGIGNGISLIIFANIVARLPSTVAAGIFYIQSGSTSFTPMKALATLVMFILVVMGIVYIQFAERRIGLPGGRTFRGGRMYAGHQPRLDLKVNTAGVIPVIFASSILMLPLTFQQFTPPLEANPALAWIHTSLTWIVNILTPGTLTYTVIDVVLIVFFSFFYTAIVFNPKTVAENLQKSGRAIPGISHGKKTEEFLEGVLRRITWVGAFFLAAVAVFPDIVQRQMEIPGNIANFLGGTSLIIVVGVAIDTVRQIDNQLKIREYDRILKGRIHGRSGM
ncbi:MAG TPA: preprotein translocase subunit SecY [bacterium]|nr:preprotein translocase subunit SecY [bacterium]HQL61970.1 preprotein translocase subunit SecY [bacterium]